MGTLMKWLIGILLTVVILVAAAVVILPAVIDPNDYKPQIVAAAEKQLGRAFAIERDLQLSVFPWLGIETGGVRVGNAAGFSDQPMAEVEELGVKVKLLPLISRKVEVDTLVIRGLRLNLEKDAQGRTNWADLAGGQQPDEAGQQPTDAPAGGSAVAIRVNGIEVEDARVTWDDRQAGQRYVVDGLRLETGAIAPGETVPVEAGMVFTSEQPAMRLDASLAARVTGDEGLQRFDIAGLLLTLAAAGEGLPEGGVDLELAASVAADLAAGSVAIDDLRVSGPAMTATGSIALTDVQTNPAATGQFSLAETNPKTLAAMFAAPIETTDPDALTRLKGDVTLAYRDGAIRLDPLSVTLDDSTLAGHVHLLDTTGPTLRTVLKLDRIDLDRYLPPAAAEGEAAPAGDTETGKAGGDPFAALRTLDLDGRFEVGSLKVNNLRMSAVNARVVSKSGVLKIDPMGASLYEGSLKGAVELNASGETPKVKVRQDLAGIQIAPLLQDLAGEGRLLGSGNVNLDIGLVGLSEAEIRRSLNGKAGFSLRDGAVKGINVAQTIRDAAAALNLADERFDVGTPGQTDFSELSATVDISNGLIRNRDLSAKSPLLRVSGSGDVDLARDSIDYLLTTELVGSLAGQGGKGAGDLAGVPIPIRIRGSLSEPSIRPDVAAAVSDKAKAEVKQKVQEKLEETIKEKAGGDAEGLLRGILGR